MHSEGSKKIKREYVKLLSWSFQLLMTWQNNPERDCLPPTAMYSLINSGKLMSEYTQFNRLHQKNLHKNILLVEGEQRKLIYTILGVHDKFLSSLASIKY